MSEKRKNKTLLLQGDCFEMLDKIEDNSVGSVVSDPPYLIDFMNKGWDSADNIAASPELYKKLFTKMKHGGYVALFGHSRTHHRIMVALEEGGFEIKDTLTWLYGQGFPKNHNISISIDKKLKGMKARGSRTNFGTTMLTTETMDKDKDGKVIPRGTGAPKHEPMCEESKKWEGYGTALKPAVEFIVLAQKPRKGTYANNCLTYGVGGLNIDECRVGYESTPNAATNPLYRKENNYKTPAKGQESNGAVSFTSSNNDAKTEGRFPANLILSHSEGCVKVGESVENTSNHNAPKGTFAGGEPDRGSEKVYRKQENTIEHYKCDDDCAVRLLNEQSGMKKGSGKVSKGSGSGGIWNPSTGKPAGDTYNDSGGASRFFYCAKVSKKERNFGVGHREKRSAEKRDATGAGLWETKGFNKPQHNHHPTLKPIALMRWLVRLITPPEETCLDLFMGAGSTGGACVKENRDFIGIELDNDYFSIAADRIAAWQEELDE